MMMRLRFAWRRLVSIVSAVGAVVVALGAGPVLAQAEGQEEAMGDAKPSSWTLPYLLVIMAIGLGMLVVLRSSRRRDRARPETYAGSRIMDDDDDD